MANNASAGATPVEADATSVQSNPATTSEQATATVVDEPLGESGRRALEAERAARSDAEKRAKTLATELEELRKAQMSESERRDARLAELERKEADWQRERTEMLLASTVERQAAKIGFTDPGDALAMLDRGSITTADDGRPQNVESLLSDLAKTKPYLLARRVSGSADSGTLGAIPAATGFTRSQLRDPKFFEANKDAILEAAKKGLIRDE